MSAFAMHAKTSAFAAGARVLSSQKKTNNNSNRCERPSPQSFLCDRESRGMRKICFFDFVREGKIRERKREREKKGEDCASISNNHFHFWIAFSLSFSPLSLSVTIIVSYTHRIIARTTMMWMMMMTMRVCSSRYTSSRARVYSCTRSHRALRERF